MATATTMKIEDLCNWSAPKRLHTKQGPRQLRTAEPTQLFWRAWKESKAALKDAGVSVGKSMQGVWQAQWWLADEQAEQAIEDSRKATSDVQIPCPQGQAYLPFQLAGMAYALQRDGVLFGDEMGLGKTVQAIGLINSRGCQTVLVICPASLRLNWRNELRKWLVAPLSIAVVNGGSQKDWDKSGAATANVVVINYDVASKHRDRLTARNWDMLICDEAHLMKNPKTARCKAILGERRRDGSFVTKPLQARWKAFLTGTPILNRPVELWPLVQALDPQGMGKNFFMFAKRYCDAHMDRHGWDFSGASNLEEMQLRLRASCMVRRLKSEVLAELPAKIHQVIELPANGASSVVAKELRAYDSYRQYIEELESELEQMDRAAEDYEFRSSDIRSKIASAHKTAFTEMSAMRHEVAVAKAPKVIEFLEGELEDGPVVCFAHHKDVVDMIMQAFGARAVRVTGDTPMAQRQEAVEAFQGGKVELFVGNIQAAGVGLTLTRSSRVIFAELDWVPANLAQASDRCHRIGQHDNVLVKYLVLEDSLDQQMVGKLIAKQAVTDSALDTVVEKAPSTVAVAPEKAPRKPVETIQVALAPAEPEMPEAQRDAILMGLRMLAGMCDGARAIDGAGFNKLDSCLGRELASLSSLSPRQLAIGQRMINQYRRQLPSGLVLVACGGPK